MIFQQDRECPDYLTSAVYIHTVGYACSHRGVGNQLLLDHVRFIILSCATNYRAVSHDMTLTCLVLGKIASLQAKIEVASCARGVSKSGSNPQEAMSNC
jgi:hypothetical protein